VELFGRVNFKRDISNEKEIISDMVITLNGRGPDEWGLFLKSHVNLGHRRLSIIDKENGKQPMSQIFNDNTYTIVYNGQLYNCDELKQILEDNGFSFKGYSDTEILLKAYIFYGKDVCNHLNGIFSFAIWNSKKEELFLARDQFGIKPLYYAILEDDFIFSSEIKGILKFPKFRARISKQEINELLGIGPSHTPGRTPFKNIEEVKPAHFKVITKDSIYDNEYWKLETKEHTDDFKTTVEKIKFLVNDATKRQLVSDVPLCTLLSGGLDSSIITAIASKEYKKQGKRLKTFSVDYVDQDKNFVKSDFQPNSDNYYIDLMVKEFETEHTKIVLDTPDLFEGLKDALIARDFPGMADVDSSILLLFRKLKENGMTVGITGECSDEIFGGYPWYFREDGLNSTTFPWSLAIEERQSLLNKEISKKIDLKEYVDTEYSKSVNKVEYLDIDSIETKLHRKLIYLTSNWFMQTLLDRTDRASMYNGFEARVPFCDYRIVEYLWNVPWEMKAFKGREKGLLRYAMENLLPKEIIYRKKSPYPKTHNPNYLEIVKRELTNIMNNKNSRIKELLDEEYIWNIINTDGKAFARPWFGQLMTGPQLMAYLIQVNMWLDEYNVEILV